ncbi:RND family efflux transporter, MFP subunit [Prosthecobacter debontii]|uniref:RND family efflux transporter, MFP subunit n=1 Tax=Prosthecobacter debontii TaxID=48467 RepID=A0A1T4YUG7_9BACT|nr:efflux RND transporter periplasmic adaptor subunit [Prosthecobacter debontii]SKB04911.1 RND family efflux transporter, MFP subunit [Prosthecobacter debontii]
MKKALYTTLVVSSLTLAACHKPPAAPTEAPPQTAAITIQGDTDQASERSFPRYLRVTGQLTGKNDAVIAADATGRVLTTPVERGTQVAAGDVLVTLDDRQAKLSLAEANAALELAKAQLTLAKNEQARNQPLAKMKAISDSDYQKLLTEASAREADLAATQARRDLAQKAVDDCTIRAVFGGVVSERMVEPGEYLRPDSAVARVVDISQLRLVLNVPETQVGVLETGRTVEFTTAAYPDQRFTGTLKFLGAAMRESSRDLVVEAVVDNASGKLRPGFFCDARILLREEKAVAVPDGTLRIEGSRRKVFVITAENTLSERLVEIGDSRDGFTEIRRGVATGEKVLLNPSPEATDGLAFQPAA